jgi:hypothetical protein
MRIEDEIKIINEMSREEMCSLWRFAPVGHKYFQRGNGLTEAFEKRFKELGGFSPEISKSIGWKK